MSNIGLIIKQSRLEMNIKQVNLAKGICSVSYLSKVENNKLFPSDNILFELLKKLKLTLNNVNAEAEKEISEDFKTKYKNAIIYRNKDLIRYEITSYNAKKIYLLNDEYSNNILLMLIRMYIVTEGFKEVEILIEHVKLNQDELTSYQKCILNIDLALLSYYKDDYKNAVKYIEKAIYYEQFIVLEKWELADLYNITSICYLITNNNHSSIEFSVKSLNLYRDLLFFNRSIDGYITAGIAYKRNKKYKDAEEYFKSAHLLIEDRGLEEFEGIIFQNLGALYAIQNDSKRSIDYYIKSLKSNKNNEGYLTTIFSIVKEYSKLKSKDDVLKWCKIGSELQAKEKEKHKSFFYHFKIFEEMHNKSSNLSTLLINALCFFENINDYRHVNKYSILLADYYFEMKQMKNAGLYYKKANEIRLVIKSITFWEDL